MTNQECPENRLTGIDSLADYINEVVQLKSDEVEVGLNQKEVVFRGLSSASYELTPSLAREPSEYWINSLVFVERDLISEAMQKCPDILNNNDLPVTKLAKLQHFGIPTRLMDVTANALVALYFACQRSKEYPDEDGEVVAFSGFCVPALDTFANIIADTYRLTQNSFTPLENYFYRAVKQNYAIILQYPNWETEHENSINSFRTKISRPLLINSIECSTRQKNQQGKFILFPNELYEGQEEWNVCDRLVRLSKDSASVIKRIIIPASIKSTILSQLSLLGISKEFLFADSVEAVFAAVKKHQESRYEHVLP